MSSGSLIEVNDTTGRIQYYLVFILTFLEVGQAQQIPHSTLIPHVDTSFLFVMVVYYGATVHVIIPKAGHHTILDKLHDTYQGASV